MKFLVLLTSCFLIFNIFGCSSFYYYPDSYIYYRPDKLPVVPTQFELKDRQGRKIVGWYFKNKRNIKPKARILFFHGNGQNLSSHFASLFWILDYGYDFYIFDYPGYGGSEGDPDRDSTVEAGYTSLKWLKDQKPEVPVAIFGQSLGGNVALYTTARYQKEFPVCQITIESSFLSYRHVGRTVLAKSAWTWPLIWVPYVFVTDYKSASENIDKISPTPLVIMHGNKDSVVSFSNGQALFQAAREPKEFWEVDGGDHIETFVGSKKEEFRSRYLEVLKKNCSG